MQTSKTLARLYCPNPKDPTEGLRQKANGVWERNEVIDGKRKSFSSRDPIEAWRKRSEYIITREERRQEEQLLEELGPLFEDNLRRSLLISHGDVSILWSTPICWFFIALTALSLFITLRKECLERKKSPEAAFAEPSGEE